MLKHRRSPSSDTSNDKESMNILELRASRARDARKQRKSILMQRRMRTTELTSVDLSTTSDHTRMISLVVQKFDAIRQPPNQRVVNEASQSDKLNEEYVDIGLPTHECEDCGAIFWYEERVNKSRNCRKSKFSLCCLNGKVELPKMRNPPETLEKLLLNNDARRPYVYRLHGQNMHLMGELLPDDGENPQFSQLYIYDTDNELLNRMRNASGRVNSYPFKPAFNDDPCDATVVIQLSEMLDSLNPLRQRDARVYNMPTADEITALIVGDFDPKKGARDIIVEKRSGTLQRISELHPLYLPLQYPLLFPRGEDDYREDAVFRLDLLSRVFKIKLNSLMRDITKNFLFGSCKAEIPDPETNPKLYEAVKTFMVHGPCGSVRKSSPCMINSRCSKHFPKKFTERTSFDEDGYCKYHRRDSSHFVEKNGIKLDNRFVVPYNPTLLLRYQTHINVEFCNQSCSIKYLFKYVRKGYDKVIAVLCSSESNYSNEDNVDEIKMYYECRYISACEAAWRIFGFDINFREPSVERLPFHLPDQQGVVFGDHDSIDSVVFNATVKQTKFLAWFEANKRYPKAKSLTYAQFPSQFVYKTDWRQWFERKSGRSIRRLYYVAPGLGELHYLRLLLTFTKGPTCYEDIRTINGVVYPTFKDACYVMGLLDDDKEYIEGIIEDLHLDDENVKDIALAEIEKILKLNGRSLANFPPMPMPNQTLMQNVGNLLINEELNYDMNKLKLEHDILLSSLTIASSGIASQLILGGSTAHSRFTIPLNIDGNFTCHIVQGSDLAELMVHTKLIIWDEAPMALRHCFEALDRTLRDIMKYQNAELSQHPFGGNVVVFGGDGTIGNIINDEEHEIDIDDILIGNVDDPIRSIVDNTYSNFLDNFHRHDYFLDRAILSPTLDDVAKVNDFMLSLLPSEKRIYLSSDTMCNQQPTSEIAKVYTTEFLNTISGSGLPYHELKLKVGAPIMLLLNIDRSM
ncbi:uncharacterized protein G2W53_007476 [Senna tora]|uniref:ATP-dependent DNA helicase n=1 Tax=Senna tora TaxID=362788 RepID=A0A835CE95_9FABA|nr:uncharacterized protein G2W53_007476 [Senna tora]